MASIVLGDEEEEAILQSITLQSIDHVIDEVRAILEATSDLMVSQDQKFSCKSSMNKQVSNVYSVWFRIQENFFYAVFVS